MEKVPSSKCASEEKERVTRRQFLKNLGSLIAGGAALRVFGPDKEKAMPLVVTSPIMEDIFAEVDYESLTDVWNYLEQDEQTFISVPLVKDKFIHLSIEQKIAIFTSLQDFFVQKIPEIQLELESVLEFVQSTLFFNKGRARYAEVYKKTNNFSHALEAYLHAFDKIFTDIMPGQKQSFLTEMSAQKKLLKRLEDLHSEKI